MATFARSQSRLTYHETEQIRDSIKDEFGFDMSSSGTIIDTASKRELTFRHFAKQFPVQIRTHLAQVNLFWRPSEEHITLSLYFRSGVLIRPKYNIKIPAKDNGSFIEGYLPDVYIAKLCLEL